MTIYIERKTAIFAGLTLMMLPGIIGWVATLGVAIIGAIALGMARLIEHALIRASAPVAPTQRQLTQWIVSDKPVSVRWPIMIEDNQR